MSQQACEQLLYRFVTVYGDPKTDDVVSYLGEYTKALRTFGEKVIAHAGDRILQNHTFPTWPTIGECVKACKESAEIVYPRVAPEHIKFSALEPEPGKTYVDPERVKDLVASFAAKLEANNDFPAIQARCPIGGTIDVSRPWGEEVTDKHGNVVPIKQKQRMFG